MKTKAKKCAETASLLQKEEEQQFQKSFDSSVSLRRLVIFIALIFIVSTTIIIWFFKTDGPPNHQYGTIRTKKEEVTKIDEEFDDKICEYLKPAKYLLSHLIYFNQGSIHNYEIKIESR